MDDFHLTKDDSALTKAHLAQVLFDQIGLNKREAKDMVDAFFELIANELIAKQEVKITGFGNFVVRSKPSRPGRNPHTGEEVPIDARHVVTFHASPKLKELIKDSEALTELDLASSGDDDFYLS